MSGNGVPVGHFLALAGIIFFLGLAGLVTRRNLIQALMSLEIMANSVNLTFIAMAGRFGADRLEGLIFAVFVMVVAAAEIGMGLAFVILSFRARGNLDIEDLNLLKG